MCRICILSTHNIRITYSSANRHQAGTTPRYHVYSISQPAAKGIESYAPFGSRPHNCISPSKEIHVAALTRCTVITLQLTNIIRQYRQYPSDNLGFTGYQPYRPPTEPYERATASFPLQTSHSKLHTSHFSLHTAQSTLHTSHFTLHTSHCLLPTPNFTLLTSHCTLKLHTPHFMRHMSNCLKLTCNKTKKN